jgi:hypothetical protein
MAMLWICALLTSTIGCHIPSQGDQDLADIAESVVKNLHSAERIYRRDHSRYGRLEELGPQGAKLITEAIASGNQYGYVYEIEPKADKYVLRARPQIWGRTGIVSFYSDESEVIRMTVDSEPADAKSKAAYVPPKLDQK